MSYMKYILAAVAAIVICWLAYATGYDKAKTEGELALEQLKLANAEAVIQAQERVKEEYNEKVNALNADLADARKLNADRLQQLQTFSSTSRSLEACYRDRERLADLAVRGEELLGRANGYLRAMIQEE